jgi:hypothetical protein
MKKLAFPLLALLVAWGCGKREEPKQADATSPGSKEPSVVATFIKGQVQYLSDKDWKAAAINDRLLLSDSLDLLAGSELELLPDSAQAVKLAGPQKGIAGELIAKAQQSAAAAAVSKTTSSVKKIQGAKQTLTTQTPTAVAGIRGTAGRAPLPPDSAQGDSSSQ